jgi:hydrogenase 3 maturation protease
MPAPGPSSALAAALGARLGAGPVAVLGVGSPIHRDDDAGCAVARALAARPVPGVAAIDAGPAPENRTADVRRLAPAHLLIVDCARMGGQPGAVRIIEEAEVDGVTFSTHGLPLSMLAAYLRAETGCAVTLVGIEPRSTDLGEGLSAEVERAVRGLVEALRECMTGAP